MLIYQHKLKTSTLGRNEVISSSSFFTRIVEKKKKKPLQHKYTDIFKFLVSKEVKTIKEVTKL